MNKVFALYLKRVIISLVVIASLMAGSAIGTYMYLKHAVVATYDINIPSSRTETEVNITEEVASPVSAPETVQEVKKDEHPRLSETQEKTLETIGIDPATLPTTLSDSQQDCLVTAVGKERADAIKNGATPTLFEITKGLACVK